MTTKFLVIFVHVLQKRCE